MILLILDASGSMWGRVENRPKIDIAREVIGNLLPDPPSDVRIGLMCYGHRRKGDCSDIELISDPRHPQGNTIPQAIKRLNPKGKTPIGRALKQAGERMAGDGSSNIVLVSDGLETCSEDPCAVAAALHEQAINLIIHTVGFDVSGKAVDQLRCVAEKGGGRYFHAGSAEALSSALKTLSDHIAEGTSLPEISEEPKAASSEAKSTRIRIAGPGTVKLAPAPWVSMPPYYWLLADAETGAEVARTNRDETRVKPATYQIVWRQVQHGAQDVLLSATVRVESRKTSTVDLDTGIRLMVPEGISAPFYWRLANPEGQTVAQFYETVGPSLVPAGHYQLLWRQTQHRHTETGMGEVVIRAGQLNDHVIHSGLTVSLPDWLQPPYSYSLRSEKGSSIQIGEVGAQLIPAGTYDIVWRQTQHEHSEVPWGSVTLPEDGFVPLNVDSGVTVLAGEALPPYRMIFVNLDAGWEAAMGHIWGPMPLPPGRYQIKLEQIQHGGVTTIVDELTVEPGQLLELEL